MSTTDVTTTESTLILPDGHEVYTKTWHPPSSTPSRARLIFIHGFSDHCNFYGVLFPTLATQGIKVYSFDQRGWGRSVHTPSQKGLTGKTQRVMDDITAFTKSVLSQQTEEEKDIPLFLMGHSMGGAQVLYYLATGPSEVLSKIRGFICESPFLALHPASQPNKLTVMLGRLAAKMLPSRHLVNKLDPSKLSRDADVAREFEEDPLCHDTGTLEGLAGMLDRGSDLEEGKVVVREGTGEGGKTRLWIGFGTADEILSENVCRKWFGKVQVEDKEYRVYEGWYHKLHAEPGEDKFIFANDVAKWVLDRSGPVGELGSSTAGKPKL